VEARVLDEDGQATSARRMMPAEWRGAYLRTLSKDERPAPKPVADAAVPTPSLNRPSRLKQFAVYAARNIVAKVSDLQYVVVCLLEAPLLALLLAYIIRYYNVSEGAYTFELNENAPIYIFVAVIVAIFIGLSVSAEEIIKDRKIIKRESFLHLSRSSYLLSKTLVLFGISALQAILFVLAGNSVIGIVNQTFIYWLVLFSAWACANLMGLVISDAFKSAVTIYILIPFIVIPQLMLSGALLRFEKINPVISTPASVPWYGEMITARWAFEALAVEQFMNNPYGRLVYPFEKTMSVAEYQRNYWLVEMRNKLSELSADVSREKQPDPALLKLLASEIERENKRQDVVAFEFRASDPPQKLIEETRAYFDQLSRYYSTLYNKSAQLRDQMVSQINPDSLLTLKSRHYNQSLADMVRNSDEIYRIVEYRGRLLQNYHQVYKDPESKFLKAHFYAPEKPFFGKNYPTLWVNVLVLWCFNAFFFVALYFRWLPKLLGMFRRRA